MALIGIKYMLRCSQYVIENCKINARFLTSGNSNYGTIPNENKTDKQIVEPPIINTDKLLNEIGTLNKEISTMQKKNDEITDKYKRALADGENLRTRLTKQISDAKLFGIQSFCKDLLEVADVLNRATDSVPKEQINDKNPHLKSLYEGLIMTEAQLKSVFKRHGLIQVNPLNEKFNPNLHEALFQQEVADKNPGIVIVVSKIGYKLHERVVRPALVGVSK